MCDPKFRSCAPKLSKDFPRGWEKNPNFLNPWLGFRCCCGDEMLKKNSMKTTRAIKLVPQSDQKYMTLASSNNKPFQMVLSHTLQDIFKYGASSSLKDTTAVLENQKRSCNVVDKTIGAVLLNVTSINFFLTRHDCGPDYTS